MGARLVGVAGLLAAIALGVTLAAAGADATSDQWAGAAGAGDVAAQPEPAGGGPPLVDRSVLRLAERRREDRWLRERLGGLAALVTDPVTADLAACLPAEPGAVPTGDEPADVARATVALRGLEFDTPIAPVLLEPDEMAARVAEAFAHRADPHERAVERRILAALGAVPPDIDLARLRVEAFAEQVSGLYRGAREELLLRVGDPDRLSPLEQAVLAHEFEHALTDQQLGRPGQAREGPQDADQRRASAAVVEGSATLAMVQYAQVALDARERAVLRRELLQRARQGALAGYTPYLLAELQYPYTEGLSLACARYAAGGWAAVDAAYAEPPGSSAEVLFPRRTAPPAGLDPPPLDDPGAGWEQVHDDAFGAAELLWLLQAPDGREAAGLDDARARVAAWAGGRVRAWFDGAATVVGVALAQRPGEPSLCATVRAWQAAGWDAERAMPAPGTIVYSEPGRVVAVRCTGAGVRVAIAPAEDPALAVVGDDFLNLGDDR